MGLHEFFHDANAGIQKLGAAAYDVIDQVAGPNVVTDTLRKGDIAIRDGIDTAIDRMSGVAHAEGVTNHLGVGRFLEDGIVNSSTPAEICASMDGAKDFGLDVRREYPIDGKPVKSLFQSCAEHDGAAVKLATRSLLREVQAHPESLDGVKITPNTGNAYRR